MKKKLMALLSAAAIAVSGLALGACGGGGGGRGENDFVVLAVKEETVKDYNDMQVFKDISAASGKKVLYKFNTSSQYSNNSDPVGDSSIDAIYHAGFSNLNLYNYGRRGRIVAIDEYLDSMPNFKKILEDRPDIAESLKSPDGHIYSLPRVEEMGLNQNPNILFVNKAWIKKLMDDGNMPSGVNLKEEDLVDGLDISRSDFKKILQKFNELDMDGDNNTQNEVPLSFVSGNWQGNESDFIASFGVPENVEHKVIKDGKIIFTIEDEKWFNAICEMNDWFHEGLIRTSSYDKDQDQFLAAGQDGKYGAFYWWEKDTVVKKDLRDNYIVVKPLKDDDGNRYVGVSNKPEVEKSAAVVLGSCKDKAGMLSYFDKFFEPDFSAQLNYGSISAGAFKAEKENNKLIPNDDHGEQSADDFRMKNAPYGVVYLTKEVWDNNVEMESRAKLRLDLLGKYVTPYVMEGIQPIPNLNYTDTELNDLQANEGTLAKNITSKMTGWITKEKPSKSDWQDFIKTNKNLIDAIKKINQDGYDRYLEATKK